MTARAGFLSCLTLLTLLAGCLQEEPTSATVPGIGTTEPDPQESENTTITFYLLFPNPCPDEPVGNTTYDREEPHGGVCGNSPTGGIRNHCATFKVHDDQFTIYENDTLYANIDVGSLPGPTESPHYLKRTTHFIWRDTQGIVAEAHVDDYSLDAGYVALRTETEAIRDSHGQIWLDISTDAHCRGVGTGLDIGFKVTRHSES